MTLMSLYRPQTPREMALRAVQIYARHWRLWIALAALAVLPVQALSLAAAPAQADMLQAMDDLARSLGPDALEAGALADEALLQDLQALGNQAVGVFTLTLGLGLLGLMIQAVVLGGAGALMTVRADRGEHVSLGQALTTALGRRLVPLLGGHLVVGTVIVGLLITILLISGVLLSSPLFALICLSVFALGIVAYIYLAWFPLLAPLLVLEHGPLSVLLQRAWYFGKKRVFQVFTAVTVFLLLRFAALTVAGMLAAFLGIFLPEGTVLALGLILDVLVLVLIAPLEAVFYTLLLLDARQQLLPEADAESPFAASTAPGAETVAPPPEPFLTAADLPNVLTVAFVTLGLVFVVSFVASLFGA